MADPESLVDKATETLVEHVAERLEQEDTLSGALQGVVVPYSIGTDQYGRSADEGFSFKSMVKLYLYKKIKQYSDSELERRLSNWKYLHHRFDITRVPTQQTFSYTWNNRFSDVTRRALNEAATEITSIAVEEDVITEELAPDSVDETDLDEDGTPKREHKREKAQQSIRLARKHAIPHFNTQRADNKQYSDEAIFEMLARMCSTRGSANSESEYAWLTDDDYTADGSTILRAMKKIGSKEGGTQLRIQDFQDTDAMGEIHDIRDAVTEPFNKATDNIISSINGDTPFDDRRNIAAIDITYEQIHISPWEDTDKGIPDESFPMMASGYKNSEDEYARGFKYATITLVGDNVPIILGVEPVKNNSKWEPDDAYSDPLGDVVERLLERAQQFVDLDLVLFDQEFYDHDVFNTVAERDLNYLTPKKKYANDYTAIEDIEQHLSADAAIERDVVSSDGEREHELNFLYVPSTEQQGEYTVFATNMQGIDPDEIRSAVNTYRRRWDIENQFKSIKDFMPRTSSMDFRVRYLNFVFTVLMYNLWRLTDYLIKRALGIDVRADPVLGTRTFARAVGNYLRSIG